MHTFLQSVTDGNDFEDNISPNGRTLAELSVTEEIARLREAGFGYVYNGAEPHA